MMKTKAKAKKKLSNQFNKKVIFSLSYFAPVNCGAFYQSYGHNFDDLIRNIAGKMA